MKLKNIKSLMAATGILVIATVGIIISGSGKDDVSEAEVSGPNTEVITEVVTEQPTTEVVTTEVPTTEAPIYTFNAVTTTKMVEVTTEKQEITTERATENTTEKATEKKQESKKETKKVSKSEKVSDTASKAKETTKTTDPDSKKSEKSAMSDVKSGTAEDKKEDDEETAKIAEERKIIEEQQKASEEAKQKEEEESAKYEGGIKLQYSAAYNICDGHLTRSNGSIRYNGHRETWYSTNEAAGKNTAWYIPGKHVADDGTIRDEDGYICVASSDYRHGTVIMTSVGPGKVYDCGCSHGTVDVYTNW